MTEPTKPIDDELWKEIVKMWYSAYHDGMRVPRSGGDDGNELKDVDRIMQLITADRKQLLDKVEEIIGEDNFTGAPFTQPYKEPSLVKNELRAKQRTALAKLRKELGL